MQVVFQKQIYFTSRVGILKGSQLASSPPKLRLKYTLNGSRLWTLLFESQSQLENETGLEWRLFIETPCQVFRLLFP